MDQNAFGEDSDNIDWDTEDELEIQSSPLPSSSRLTYPDGEATVGDAEAITTTDLSHSKLIHHFVGIGFPEELVAKAIEENGEKLAEAPVAFGEEIKTELGLELLFGGEDELLLLRES
ncbi:hypothetical protein RHMOL_Rhmol06G0253000 [Rhododendron molle]|uniref:Uncharacterized protein n=1 Tax=Rhododendron molle TaxID=49168 RepID=A0ACC0NG75_RHOML|nr:hypothetical protein RHMOL_Rhmol06G0253000 [Rhododendron molle]